MRSLEDEGCVAACEFGHPPAGEGASLVFLILILLGVITLAPSVLLPEWRKFEAISAAAQYEQYKLDTITEKIEAHKRLLHALRSDPAVVSRLAQRELNYRVEGSVAVPVKTPVITAERPDRFQPTPLRPPAVVGRIAGILPNLDYDAVFCNSRTRPYVMVLSVSLIIVAFIVFAPRDREPAGYLSTRRS